MADIIAALAELFSVCLVHFGPWGTFGIVISVIAFLVWREKVQRDEAEEERSKIERLHNESIERLAEENRHLRAVLLVERGWEPEEAAQFVRDPLGDELGLIPHDRAVEEMKETMTRELEKQKTVLEEATSRQDDNPLQREDVTATIEEDDGH